MIRAEAAEKLRPWAETGAALAATGFGIWVFSLGGWVFWPLGLLLACACSAWALDARRRMRFNHDGLGPGAVELDEGAIRYLSPNRLLGGEIGLRDLIEIRLMRLNGRSHWRLKSGSGEALLIPADARGAELLAGAFATLPGIDMGRVAAALAPSAPTIQTVWARPVRARLT
jgi:hypothetical protein